MKLRTTSIKSKANEVKVKAWKILLSKALEEGETQALRAIIEIAESNPAGEIPNE
jgi:hypothetical protein